MLLTKSILLREIQFTENLKIPKIWFIGQEVQYIFWGGGGEVICKAAETCKDLLSRLLPSG